MQSVTKMDFRIPSKVIGENTNNSGTLTPNMETDSCFESENEITFSENVTPILKSRTNNLKSRQSPNPSSMITSKLKPQITPIVINLTKPLTSLTARPTKVPEMSPTQIAVPHTNIVLNRSKLSNYQATNKGKAQCVKPMPTFFDSQLYLTPRMINNASLPLIPDTQMVLLTESASHK